MSNSVALHTTVRHPGPLRPRNGAVSVQQPPVVDKAVKVEAVAKVTSGDATNSPVKADSTLKVTSLSGLKKPLLDATIKTAEARMDTTKTGSGNPSISPERVVVLEIPRDEPKKVDAHVSVTRNSFPDVQVIETPIDEEELPNAQVVETPSSLKKAILFNQVGGLTGLCSNIDVKKEELQTRLDTSLSELTALLRTDDPISAHFGQDSEGNPIIHTFTVFRKDPITNEQAPFYYDLTHESEWARLLEDNIEHPISKEELALLAKETRLKSAPIIKELDTVSKEVNPLPDPRSNFNATSVGDLSGQHFINHLGKASSRLITDQFYIRHTMQKMLSNPGYGMVDDNGNLNEHGERALKEMVAASSIHNKEIKGLGQEINATQVEINTKKKEIHKDDLDAAAKRDLDRLERKLDALKKEESELRQTSLFAVSWMILQLNRPVKLYKENAEVENVTTLRDALQKGEGEFDAIQLGPQRLEGLSPTLLRQRLAHETSIEFNTYVRNATKGTFQKEGKPLSEKEKAAGVEVGSLFFYQGIGKDDASLRIRNQIFHEKKGVTLEREISGVSHLVKNAQSVVAKGEVDADLKGKTPKEAVNAMIEKNFVPEDRGWLKRKFA